MKLQTQIHLKPEKNQIHYDSKVLLLGSCFAENIGAKFDYFKFQNLQNPFGIIFNPIGIEKLVSRAVHGTFFTKNDLVFHNDRWLCFDVHSDLSATNEQDLVELLNHKVVELKEYLKTASHIIFTFGSAWVYHHNASQSIVSNCHKIPQKEFTKKLLSVDEVRKSISSSISLIRSINPRSTYIGTVSPVRHLKDGFIENTRSKAHLITGLHESVESFQQLFYFPAYEILLDELRDYRFYAEDMLHPSKTAVDIIWECFSSVWISSETKLIQQEVDSIQKGLMHKPFNPSGDGTRLFKDTLQHKIDLLRKKYPNLNF